MFKINYEDPLRFRNPTPHEKFMEAFHEILLATKKITYFDERVSKLWEFCEEKTFKKAFPIKQYQELIKFLDQVEKFAKSNVPTDNFLEAIRTFDTEKLLEMEKQITQTSQYIIQKNLEAAEAQWLERESFSRDLRQLKIDCQEAIKNPHAKSKFSDPQPELSKKKNEIILKPVNRKLLRYYKEQANVAAIWWLNAIKQYISSLNKVNPLTQLQERLVLTNIADLAWEKCQIQSSNMKKRFFSMNLQDLLVRQIFPKNVRDVLVANIRKSMSANLYANGDVTYCALEKNPPGTILYCHKKSDSDVNSNTRDFFLSPSMRFLTNSPWGFINKIEPKLPSDEIIHYRDTISTITTAHAPHTFALLPRPLMTRILVEAKPDDVPMETACYQLKWNQARLKEMRPYLNTAKKDEPLVKHEIDETMLALYLKK